MRPLPLLFAALLVSSCGALPWTGSPPAITLTSQNGDQKAVPGSYCITGGGRGECADYPVVHPTQVTVVSAEDQVAVTLTDASFVRSSGCHSDTEQDCIGWVRVLPLGCEGPEVDRVPLSVGSRTDWTVDLDPGAYQLDVFGYFESSNSFGDVTGSLGLVVAAPDAAEELGVFELQPEMQVCPFELSSG